MCQTNCKDAYIYIYMFLYTQMYVYIYIYTLSLYIYIYEMRGFPIASLRTKLYRGPPHDVPVGQEHHQGGHPIYIEREHIYIYIYTHNHIYIYIYDYQVILFPAMKPL